MENKEVVFNTKEVATYLGVSFGLIRKLILKKEIPYFKVGTSIRFKKSTIDDWTSKQERGNCYV